MSSSFHTLEEGMKITLYLMFLQKPFAFPTSCSLQPLRLRAAGARYRPARRRARGCARPRSAAALPMRAPQPGLSYPVQNTTGLGRCGEDAHQRKRFHFPGEAQVRGGSWEPPSLPLLLRMRGETGFPPSERSPGRKCR